MLLQKHPAPWRVEVNLLLQRIYIADAKNEAVLNLDITDEAKAISDFVVESVNSLHVTPPFP